MIAVSPLLLLRDKATSIGKPLGYPDEEATSVSHERGESATAMVSTEPAQERSKERSPEASAKRSAKVFPEHSPEGSSGIHHGHSHEDSPASSGGGLLRRSTGRCTGVSPELLPERSAEIPPSPAVAEGNMSSPSVGSVPSAGGAGQPTVGYFESTIKTFESSVGYFLEKIGSNVSEAPTKDLVASKTTASGSTSANQSTAGAATMVGNGEESAEEDTFGPTSDKVVKMFAIGLGSGFLAGVFGVGGGVVTVPALSLATDLGHKQVRG